MLYSDIGSVCHDIVMCRFYPYLGPDYLWTHIQPCCTACTYIYVTIAGHGLMITHLFQHGALQSKPYMRVSSFPSDSYCNTRLKYDRSAMGCLQMLQTMWATSERPAGCLGESVEYILRCSTAWGCSSCANIQRKRFARHAIVLKTLIIPSIARRHLIESSKT